MRFLIHSLTILHLIDVTDAGGARYRLNSTRLATVCVVVVLKKKKLVVV
jgi:hypothetical protein